MSARWARPLLSLTLALALAPEALAQGVRELAFLWVQGDFRSPLSCIVDGAARQALRRVRIQPGPRQAARPSARVVFFDLAAPPGTRCASVAGQAEPNVIGHLDLVFEGRTRPDTGEVDFRNALRRDGGFEFKIESGRLRVSPTDSESPAEQAIDFAGGRARFDAVAPGSDAARRLASFGAARRLVFRVEVGGEPPLAFDLVELAD